MGLAAYGLGPRASGLAVINSRNVHLSSCCDAVVAHKQWFRTPPTSWTSSAAWHAPGSSSPSASTSRRLGRTSALLQLGRGCWWVHPLRGTGFRHPATLRALSCCVQSPSKALLYNGACSCIKGTAVHVNVIGVLN